MTRKWREWLNAKPQKIADPVDWFCKVSAVVLFWLMFAATIAHCGPLPPLPGWWRQGNQYLPCNYQPYVNWADPQSGQLTYAQYTTVSFPVQSNVADGTYAGQGGPNHTDQYYDRGRIVPVNPGDHPPPTWHYPCPVNPALSAIFLNYPNNAGQSCPTTTDALYTQKILSNPVWIESYAVIKATRDADCNNPPPTFTPVHTLTPTPARTPTPTLTCPPTPAQSAGAFTDYIYEAVKEGYFAGCGPSLFCPGFQEETANGFVTRAQEAYYLLIGAHGLGYKPPPCTPPGSFTDVPCAH